ncbi:hypothetical protein BDY21DRAFT_369669 [Lineolata rhizophorae]|uniref:HCP-like protein n=1 Tax=Lineolata rhizophorae TaxID=578093 RepID=A0A6A6P769_9PEZI|nr:hypothetical protein BDY21DRAFT_369669 [Lineolata rhizophorae]
MTGNRPNFINLRANSEGPPASSSSSLLSSGDLPSPRTGEVPPALSPLDAFAFQGRLLARRFEQPSRDGRRLSRLPATTVASEFEKARPSYLRSASAGSGAETPPSARDDGTSTRLPFAADEPDHVDPARPKSVYPLIQSDDGPFGGSQPSVPFQPELSRVEEGLTPPSTQPEEPRHQVNDYFAIPRAHSPEQIDSRVEQSAAGDQTPHPPAGVQRTITIDSVASSAYSQHSSLAPPRTSPSLNRSPRASPTVRSVPGDSSDDVDGLSLGGSLYSLPQRQLSTTNTSVSRSHSPYSPQSHSVPDAPPRSPSVCSEYSVGGTTRLPRPPHFNFSRPLSRASRPSFDAPSLEAPSRQASGDSGSGLRPSFDLPGGAPSRQDSADSPVTPFPNDFAHTPISMNSEEYFNDSDASVGTGNMPAPSYIYSKYSLPRGRILQRESISAAEFLGPHFQQWDVAPSRKMPMRSAPTSGARPPSPPSPPRPRTTRTDTGMPAAGTALGTPPLGVDTLRPKTTDAAPHPGFTRSHSHAPPRSPREASGHKPTGSSPSMHSSSNATIKPSSASISSSIPPPVPTSLDPDMTPEDHLDRGIERHEAGALQESTYHFRLAAKAGLPTAMLLYALACRHGWGMRRDMAEGVLWLRRAVDCAGGELADDEEGRNKAATGANVLEHRTHRAQFALGVYELGVSYMNGWGIQQDKALAVRCFEIAGGWGDADALAEAGFCYTEGIGVKKDLKKAARLYRAAEAKGMSMAGNSWIYKDKYMDDADSTRSGRSGRSGKKAAEKKSRDKSRTRTIFGRKKAAAASASP